MSENVPTYKAGWVTVMGKASLTYAEVRELRLLFDHVAETSAAAGDSLGRAGPLPSNVDLPRLTELAARLEALAIRVRQILN
jgi:hypothetical protein